MKYEKLFAGTQMIESHLHRHLAEHLNAEIVLRTVTDVAVAVDWIRSTFLYVRAFHNPTHYGLAKNLSKEAFESKLQGKLSFILSYNSFSCINYFEKNLLFSVKFCFCPVNFVLGFAN